MSVLQYLFVTVGTAAAVVGVIWTLCDKVFKLGGMSHRIASIEDTLSKIEERLDSLPCKEHHDDILKVVTLLAEKSPKYMNALSMKASPRMLNETGKKLYGRIGGDTFLSENKDALFGAIRRCRPLVALDVEVAAQYAVATLVPTAAFNGMKDFVYNEPSWDMPDVGKHDITLEDVCFVLGLKLRDLYLDEVGVNPVSCGD